MPQRYNDEMPLPTGLIREFATRYIWWRDERDLELAAARLRQLKRESQ
jgi:hypothetical protein